MKTDDTYTLIARLGEGGMAEVYKALKKGPDGFEKPIAVKRILPHHADNKSFIRMLSAEARLHAQLDHPNIVQLLDFFEKGDAYIMALEYVPGKNLRHVQNTAVDRSVPISWQASLHIVCETLKGLDFAHKKRGARGPLNIVHRDMSPQNILISYDGIVKLSDFGIARADIERDETQTGVLKGKQRYLAPEQLQSKDLDFRCDLFSTGVVLYELICRKHPFDTGGNHYETMLRIGKGEFEPSEKIRADVPKVVHQAISMALQNEPKDRPKDAATFRSLLLSAQTSEWLYAGTERLKEVMNLLYPNQEDRSEVAIEKTPLLSIKDTPRSAGDAPARSLISGVAEITGGVARRAKLHKNKEALIVGLGSLLLFVTLGVWKALSPPREVEPEKSKKEIVEAVGEKPFTTVTVSTPIPTPEPTPEATPAPVAKKSVASKTPQKTTAKPRTQKKAKRKLVEGSLYFRGPKGTVVMVNGNPVRTLPGKSIRLRPKTYLIGFKAPGEKLVTRPIEVKEGERKTIRWPNLD